jgi:hypothetical protein
MSAGSRSDGQRLTSTLSLLHRKSTPDAIELEVVARPEATSTPGDSAVGPVILGATMVILAGIAGLGHLLDRGALSTKGPCRAMAQEGTGSRNGGHMQLGAEKLELACG